MSIRGPVYVYLVYIIMWPSVRCVHQRTGIRLSGLHHYVAVSTVCPSEDRYTSIWSTSLCGRQYGVSIRGPVYVYLVYIIMWPSVWCVHQRTGIRLSGVHHYVAVSTVCPSEDRYTSIWSTSLCGPSVRCVHQRTAIRLSGLHHYLARQYGVSIRGPVYLVYIIMCALVLVLHKQHS